jgi:hypothetical protein
MEAAMYCPKCGAQSDNVRFCRSCGTNLVLVSDALSDTGQAKSYRGQTTLGIFHPATVTNERRSLHGHNAAAVFGNVIVDLTAEDLPPGETTIHLYSIFGSADVLVHDDVGVRITGVTLFSGIKVRGQQLGNGIFSVNEYISPGYYQSVRRLRIDATSVFSGVKLRR